MRLQVIDLELKARYWKSQYDIRYYTLEAEKLQPDYAIFLEATAKANQEAYEKLMEQMKNNPNPEPETVQNV